jgi:hypothetical protein
MGNVKELIKRAGIDNKRTFNSESTGFSAGTTQTKEDIPVAFKRIVQENTGLKADTFVLDDETKTVTNLRKVIAAMPGLQGYTLEEARPGYDVVDLKDKEGNIVTSFDLNEMDDTIAQSYVNQLLEMSSNNSDIEQQAMYVGKKRDVSKPAPRSSTRTSNQIPR